MCDLCDKHIVSWKEKACFIGPEKNKKLLCLCENCDNFLFEIAKKMCKTDKKSKRRKNIHVEQVLEYLAEHPWMLFFSCSLEKFEE